MLYLCAKENRITYSKMEKLPLKFIALGLVTVVLVIVSMITYCYLIFEVHDNNGLRAASLMTTIVIGALVIRVCMEVRSWLKSSEFPCTTPVNMPPLALLDKSILERAKQYTQEQWKYLITHQQIEILLAIVEDYANESETPHQFQYGLQGTHATKGDYLHWLRNLKDILRSSWDGEQIGLFGKKAFPVIFKDMKATTVTAKLAIDLPCSIKLLRNERREEPRQTGAIVNL